MRVFLYRPGSPTGGPDVLDVVLPAEPSLAALHAVVDPLLGDGAVMEHVTVLFDGRRADMFVDEHGHGRGLPRNESATAIYRAAYLANHPGTDAEGLPW